VGLFKVTSTPTSAFFALDYATQLADDAKERGWEREVDRHQRVADRVRSLLRDLGEPCDPLGPA